MLSDDHNTTRNYVAINSPVKFVTQAFLSSSSPCREQVKEEVS